MSQGWSEAVRSHVQWQAAGSRAGAALLVALNGSEVFKDGQQWSEALRSVAACLVHLAPCCNASHADAPHLSADILSRLKQAVAAAQQQHPVPKVRPIATDEYLSEAFTTGPCISGGKAFVLCSLLESPSICGHPMCMKGHPQQWQPFSL